MNGKFIPEIPGENVSYPGKKIPRPRPTRNKIPRPWPTRNKIPRPDPTRKYSLKCSPTPDRFRSGPVRSGETRGFGLPRRSLIGACWENLPKIVKITLLQFKYEFGHGNFFTVWSSQYFQNIYRQKNISIDGNSHNVVTKLQQVPCFRDVCLFSIQMKPFNHS